MNLLRCKQPKRGLFKVTNVLCKQNLTPVFTGSKITSYECSMPTYSSEFKELKNSDVERYPSQTNPPQIRFISAEESSETGPKRQSTMLKADPTSTDTPGDYKVSYNVFEEGSIETLIHFLNDFDKICHGKLVPVGIR